VWVTDAVRLALAAWLLVSCSDTSTKPSREATGQTLAALNNSPIIGNFVLYAERSVRLGEQDQVRYGDIGVAAIAVSSFGPQLTVGQQVQISQGNNLLAPSVVLEPQCQVGDVQTNALTNNGAQHVGTVASYPASLMPLLPLAGNPGSHGSNVSIGAQAHVSLSPGNYGALTIGNQAQVTLAAGSYSFSSITIGNQVQVWAASGGVTILDSGTLATGSEDQIRPLGGGTADDLTILVGGADGSGGTPPAAGIGQQMQMSALLAVPHGTLSVAQQGQLTGAFVAFDIALGNQVHVTFSKGFLGSTAGQAQGSQQLSGYTPPAAPTILGPVPADTPIPLSIVLPVQNPSGLQTFIDQVSDPASATYRRYLSIAQFAAVYGLPPTAYNYVVSWAESYGSVVTTFPNNLLVDSLTTAGQVESALFVNLVYARRPDGTTFYEPDRRPSFTPPPGSGTLQLSAILGVDNYVVPQPIGVGGSSPGGFWASSDFRAAYLGTGSLCSPLTGAGQQIGIAAPGVGYTLAKNASTPGDIETYENATGLTGVPQVVPHLVNALLPIVPDGSRGCAEAALDIEMAIAMAPGATVIPFQGPYMSDVLSAMATTPNLNQGSSSFTGSDTQGGINTSQQFISEMAAQGQSFFQGSGDGGAYQAGTQNCSCACTGGSGTQTLLSCPGSCQALCPASTTTCGSVVDFLTPTALGLSDMRTLTNLTLVGGTQLSLSGSTYSETTWPGSGGGVITNVPLPTYQTNLPGLAGPSRNSPDVALVATSIYLVATGCFDGPSGGLTVGNPLPCPSGQLAPAQATVVGGTSASSPLWAGFTALINQQGTGNGPVGFLNPLLYQIGQKTPAAFNNITDGSTNANQCSFGYAAASGYNQTTGWGSPTCQLIEQAQVRPQITVGVDDPINSGPVVCMTGTGFTPGGTVTVQYAGVPQAYDAQGNPTTQVIQNNVTVAGDGTIQFLDNEQISIVESLAFAVPACTAQLEATGTVAIQAIDNTTGVSTTTEVPAALWCEVGPDAFGATCPSIQVRYRQIGACTSFTSGGNFVSVGLNAAYVVFAIDEVSSSYPNTFVFNPAGVFIQHDPIQNFFVSSSDPIVPDIFGPLAAVEATVPANGLVAFLPAGFGAGIVNTITADGAVQANETGYFLNYSGSSSVPAMNFVKSNASQTTYPFTDDCSQIDLQ
jgi:kumamolisin